MCVVPQLRFGQAGPVIGPHHEICDNTMKLTLGDLGCSQQDGAVVFQV